jgi:predicted transcriptional regulator
MGWKEQQIVGWYLQRDIAKKLGISQMQVSRDLSKTNVSALRDKPETNVSNRKKWAVNVRGSGQPEKDSARSAQILSMEAAEEFINFSHQQISRWQAFAAPGRPTVGENGPSR